MVRIKKFYNLLSYDAPKLNIQHLLFFYFDLNVNFLDKKLI